jgi:regulator of protease activity HflC (stomatin/prohibitin superfamily)
MEFYRFLFPAIILISLIGVGLGRARIRVGYHERLVVFRLGKPVDVREAGVTWLIPYVESGVKYDLDDPFDARLIADYQARFDQLAEE